MADSHSGQNGLRVQRPAVRGLYECACDFAPIPRLLLEEKTAMAGDSKLNIVKQKTALRDLVSYTKILKYTELSPLITHTSAYR